MRLYCLPFVITLFFNSHYTNCRRVNTRHHKNIHTFESKVTKSGNKDEVEKFEIAKREPSVKGSLSSLKRHDIAKKAEDKNEDDHAVKMPKNVIEPANAFNHLSDLLGLKGSFIPSQSKQRWLEDEEDSTPNPNENFNNYVKQLERHSHAKTLESEKGILPLDISPEQAALITSTADRNSQRKKFLQWEKEGGSMDTMHFPSRYIKGERSIEGNRIDSEASKRVSTEEPPSNEKIPQISKAIKGIDTSLKENGQVQSSLKDTTALNDIGSKDKKGFLSYLSEQIGPAEENHRPKSELTSHAFLATAFRSTNDQPLTHDMINKLQLDPAWDAMEAKMLSQNSRKAMPMPLPVSKIEREMMPPLGEPIGQAYLPNHSQINLVSNFHRAAGFMTQPLRGDLHPSSYYSHFQPMDQGLPQTLNVGGSLVHAFGDPWKNLKQTTYDHAEDNFPLPSPNQQLSAQSMTSSPSAAAEAEPGESMESVGEPLTKVKAQHLKEKETSKVIESSENEEIKDEKEEDVGVKIGKENGKKKPSLILVKGKKIRKQQKNRNNREETGDETGKHSKKVKESKKIKPVSHLREENTADSEAGNESEGLGEHTDDESKKKPLNVKEQKQKFLNFESDDDGQGPRFSQQESNYQEKKPSSVDGIKYMTSGNNADQSKAQKNENTGRYITHKFVNFLSDVAQHLNVDKLSIAEQLVTDVEDSKKKKAQSNDLIAKESNAINELLQRLQTKRRRVETGHGNGNKVNAKSTEVGSFRIRRKQPTVIKYIWNKGISVLKETR